MEKYNISEWEMAEEKETTKWIIKTAQTKNSMKE